MDDIKNPDRAKFARRALEYYALEKYHESPAEMETEGVETRAADLIADLLHLISAKGHCTESALRIAAMHFEAENENPEET